jgi:hypothetical protein
MKKRSLTILLLFLLTAVLGNNDGAAIQKPDLATVTQPGDFINPGSGSIVPDMELAGFATSAGTQVTHSIQKAPGYLYHTAKEKSAVIITATFTPLIPLTETYGNNHLSYNYPSHNFW